MNKFRLGWYIFMLVWSITFTVKFIITSQFFGAVLMAGFGIYWTVVLYKLLTGKE